MTGGLGRTQMSPSPFAHVLARLGVGSVMVSPILTLLWQTFGYFESALVYHSMGTELLEGTQTIRFSIEGVVQDTALSITKIVQAIAW